MDTTPENIHLTSPDLEMTEDELCTEAIRLNDKEGLSLNEIIKKMNLPFVHTTLLRKIKKFKQKTEKSEIEKKDFEKVFDENTEG